MIFSNTPRPETVRSLKDIKLKPFWLDDPAQPVRAPSLEGRTEADLTVIGAGYTGLWTALLAKQAEPGREVVLVEMETAGGQASGRNGGFIAASLTHSFQNGLNRWPRELSRMIEMGHRNLEGIEQAIRQFDIDCDYIRSGELNVALEPHEIEELKEEQEISSSFGEGMTFYDREQVRAIVNSPTYLAGCFNPANGMVNPAKLAWGLRRACLEAGVRLYEGTKAGRLKPGKNSIHIWTPGGKVETRKLALATNAFPPLLNRLSHYILPVYDYALMTEPLTESQRDSIGWRGREGLSDSANQFHYYQITKDGRILWGGYDAIYYWNNAIGPHLENRPQTFSRLAEHFFQTFPQLEGLHFTHAWGGVIDTCSRYTAFWGTAMGGKVAYSLGYTGLGVGAARFGAQVMLDLLDRRKTERTALKMVRSKPVPFPPEPLRSMVINFTRWSLARSDQRQGRRNLWLKLLDALGLGFDS
ncbi:MAG: FAD-dependent oxidoreductase [Chloroflexi bacterium]|nr:FAD-dependent oxidoreductase [Chloroflexota bacterium]